jgi:dGTPase
LAGAQSEAVRRVIKPIMLWQDFDIPAWPSAEAQVAALADDIAYATHDIDDGLRAGLIMFEDLVLAPLAQEIVATMTGAVREGDQSRRNYDVSRRMITWLIRDLVEASRDRLRELGPADADAIRQAGRPIIGFSPAVSTQLSGLKSFLFARVYRHPRVTRVMDRAEEIVRDLFMRYQWDDASLPDDWRRVAAQQTARAHARVIADFVAGMTDRYAIAEHRRLFDATPELR